MAFIVTDSLTWPAQIATFFPGSLSKAAGLAFEELGTASLLDKGLQLGALRAEQSALQMHLLLGSEQAIERRTTAVIFGLTKQGEMRGFVAGGGYDIGPKMAKQLGVASEFTRVTLGSIREGLEGVTKLDAEQKLLIYMSQEGIQPLSGGIAGGSAGLSRVVCPRCSLMITTEGGVVDEGGRQLIFAPK